MEVIFANSDLEELYVSGTSKRYRRVPDEVVKKFPRAVALLKAAKIIQEI